MKNQAPIAISAFRPSNFWSAATFLGLVVLFTAVRVAAGTATTPTLEVGLSNIATDPQAFSKSFEKIQGSPLFEDGGRITLPQGRWQQLLIQPDLQPDFGKNLRLQSGGGYGGVGNGGGGDFVDAKSWTLLSPLFAGESWHLIPNFDFVPLSESGAWQTCPGQTQKLPPFPAGLASFFKLLDSEGQELTWNRLCADPALIKVYAEALEAFWHLQLTVGAEASAFLKEIHRLNNGNAIPVKLHVQAPSLPIPGPAHSEPAWFSPEDGVVHLAKRDDSTSLMQAVNQRTDTAFLFHELGHFYVWKMLSSYPHVEEWHDFSSAAPQVLENDSDSPMFLAWSRDPYAIQTPELAALFESFSNTLELFGSGLGISHPFVAERPDLNFSSMLGPHFKADQRFLLPHQNLVQNEAYLSTILRELVTKNIPDPHAARGYQGLGSDTLYAYLVPDPEAIQDLVLSLKNVLTGPSVQTRREYLFFQWMQAFDSLRSQRGLNTQTGRRLISEYFLYDIGTRRSLRPFLETRQGVDGSAWLVPKKGLNPLVFLSPLQQIASDQALAESWKTFARATAPSRALQAAQELSGQYQAELAVLENKFQTLSAVWEKNKDVWMRLQKQKDESSLSRLESLVFDKADAYDSCLTNTETTLQLTDDLVAGKRSFLSDFEEQTRQLSDLVLRLEKTDPASPAYADLIKTLVDESVSPDPTSSCTFDQLSELLQAPSEAQNPN